VAQEKMYTQEQFDIEVLKRAVAELQKQIDKIIEALEKKRLM